MKGIKAVLTLARNTGAPFRQLFRENNHLKQIDVYYSKKSVWQGLQMIYFLSSLIQVIHKSYRQVLTLNQSSQLLLKLGHSDKFRLVYK